MDSGYGAAYAAQIGDLYVCHKITEQATGKTFYPDILYRHPWKERELVTGMQPLQRAAAHGALYDMEAAAVYRRHPLFFLRTGCSFEGGIGFRSCRAGENDGGDVHGAAGAACKGGRGISYKSAGGGRRGWRRLRNDGILQEDETVLERLFAALHCSQTMRASARQYITYAALTGYDWKAELEEWYARGLPRAKTGGKEGAA